MIRKLDCISDITKLSDHTEVRLKGWVQNIRHHKHTTFIDLVDQTGSIQVVIEQPAGKITKESCIEINGSFVKNNSSIEIRVDEFVVLSNFSLDISPSPRSNFNIFSDDGVDNLLSNRHLYIRNPKLQKVFLFRSKFFQAIRDLFEEQGFIEIHAPILSEITLYDEKTAFKTDYMGEEVFLTQCVGFYLEACVHSFSKVYNMGPSFRAEQTHGRRHLAEYWHIKAELAFFDLSALMKFVESFLFSLNEKLFQIASDELVLLNPEFLKMDFGSPFPRISYREALELLKEDGITVEFGREIPPKAEYILSLKYCKPFWIMYPPEELEPFPYAINKQDLSTVNVADLHAPGGFGELLGVAEKIYSLDELEKRASKKGFSQKQLDRLQWYFDLQSAGCIQHGGMGMGVERTIRWMLGLPHVRDAIPFPRLTGRKPRP